MYGCIVGPIGGSFCFKLLTVRKHSSVDVLSNFGFSIHKMASYADLIELEDRSFLVDLASELDISSSGASFGMRKKLNTNTSYVILFDDSMKETMSPIDMIDQLLTIGIFGF